MTRILLSLALLAACSPRYEPPAPRLYVAECPGQPPVSFKAHSLALYETMTIGKLNVSPPGYRPGYAIESVAVAAFPRTCRVFVVP